MQAVIFDLGGVLFRYAPERRWDAFAELTGRTPATIRKRLLDSGYARACDLGRLKGQKAHAEGLRLLGHRLSAARFEALWVSAFEPDPDVIALARRVRDHAALTLLSNNSELVRRGLEARYGEVLALFRPQLYSCDLGLAKPDPQVFSLALELLGTQAEETAFIDDSAANTQTATALGLPSHQFRDAAALEAALDAWSLL